MNPFYFLYIAVALWVVQQVNDAIAAFVSRAPKPFWVSWTASFLSGASLFYFLNYILTGIADVIVFLVQNALSQ